MRSFFSLPVNETIPGHFFVHFLVSFGLSSGDQWRRASCWLVAVRCLANHSDQVMRILVRGRRLDAVATLGFRRCRLRVDPDQIGDHRVRA